MHNIKPQKTKAKTKTKNKAEKKKRTRLGKLCGICLSFVLFIYHIKDMLKSKYNIFKKMI